MYRSKLGLIEQARTIESREDLVRFLQAFSEALEEEPSWWQNVDLRTFLNAMAAWAADMEGYYEGMDLPIPRQPTWRTIADLLLGASMYE